MTGSHRASAGIGRSQRPEVATIRALPPLSRQSFSSWSVKRFSSLGWQWLWSYRRIVVPIPEN